MEERRDDTLRVLLAGSREKLAEVAGVLENGRVTREERALKTDGPWCVGHVYKTDALEINMIVASLSAQQPTPIKTSKRVTYVGVKGRATVTIGSLYKQLGPGMVAYVDSMEKHVLEPVDVGCQIIQVLVGGSDD